jgi:acyl carrier protein
MFEAVRAVIEDHVDCGDVVVTPETELLTELRINSLDLVELVCAFEVEFDVEVPEKDIHRFSKVKDIVQYLETAT